MNELMQSFEKHLHEHGRSELTIEAYVNDVTRFITWSEAEYESTWNASMLNRSDLRDFQYYCRETLGLKAATWNRTIASLSVFAAWMMATKQTDHNPVKDALTRSKDQELAPRSLRKPDYKKLRNTVAEEIRTAKTETARKWAKRNAAVIACLWAGAMREGEVANLRLQDILLGERSGRIEIINAKGNKDRTIPLAYETVQTLRAWVEARGAAASDSLFIGKFGEPLGEGGIQKLVTKLAKEAHIEHITPHQLRHTAGRQMIQGGATLPEVAAFLGHARIETTRRYTLPHEEDMAKLAEMVG
jgi:integrase/recombinase XerC